MPDSSQSEQQKIRRKKHRNFQNAFIKSGDRNPHISCALRAETPLYGFE